MPFFAFTMNLRFGIMAALFEEIIFRGYIWHKMQSKQFDDISVIFTTAIFFGLFHLAGYYEINYMTSFFNDAPGLHQFYVKKYWPI